MYLFSANYPALRLRTQLIREASGTYQEVQLHSPADVFEYLRGELEYADQEHFLSIPVTAQNAVIGVHTVHIGTVNHTLVTPRDVFKTAILSGATGIILAHNHPSGDPKASPDDKNTTRLMADAGRILGINVIDHVIVGRERYFSFKKHNLI